MLMIQTHAYDGWVLGAARASAGFAVTRFLALFPLPTFLVLAGVGTSLRVRAAVARGESTDAVRGDLMRRGLEVLAAGYGVSVALGCIDGATSLVTYLRADVLHAIGLSIVLSAAIWLRGPQVTDARPLFARSIAFGLVVAALSIPATQLGRSVSGPARFVLAPFVEVPGITRMPVVPLAAWIGLGAAFAERWLARPRTRRDHLALAGASAVVAALASVGTTALHRSLGGPLDRAHPAILLNVVDLGARAVGLVALCLAGGTATKRGVGARLERELALVGRHSLVAYAVHLPFAYGRVAAWLGRGLSMPAATQRLALLVLGTWLFVRAYDAAERAWHARGRSRATS